MKVAIVGVGGVGGYFGARLSTVCSNVKVVLPMCTRTLHHLHIFQFIVRKGSPQLQALIRDGITVQSVDGDLRIPTVDARDDIARVGVQDVVLLCTKMDNLRDLDLSSIVGDETVVIPLQNGVASIGILDGMLPPGAPRCGGTVYVASSSVAPGVFRHLGVHKLVFGPLKGQPTTPIMESFAKLGERAGFDCVLSPDPLSEMWRKLCAISSVSGLCCITRSPFGVVFSSPPLQKMAKDALREAYAVAASCGARGLDPDVEIPDILKRWGGLPTARPSMLLDLEAGRTIELPYLSGWVKSEGERHRIPVPTHTLFCNLLEPQMISKM